MAEFIKLENVKKTYHMGEIEINALDGVEFTIEEGEFVVVVGQSGAGKTTVLNILGGMDTATAGSVLVADNDITIYKEKQLSKYR